MIKLIRVEKKVELQDFSHEIYSELDGVLDGSCNLEHRTVVLNFAQTIPESVYNEKIKRLNEKYNFLHPNNGLLVPLNEFNIPKPNPDWQKQAVRSIEEIKNLIAYEKVYKEWKIVDLYHNQEEKMTSIAKKLKISTFKVSTCTAFFAETGSLPSLQKKKPQKEWPSLQEIEEFLNERYIKNDEIAPNWLTLYHSFCAEFPRSNSISLSYFQKKMSTELNICSMPFSQKRSNLGLEEENLLTYGYNNILIDLYLNDKKVLYFDSCSFQGSSLKKKS